MTSRKSFLLLPAVLLVGSLGLAGCGSSSTTTNGNSQDSSQQITLNFPTWQAQEPGFEQWWEGLISAYEQQHKNVKINMTNIPYKDYVKTLTTEFSANQPPDIVHLPSANFAQFADQGWLAPLDDEIKGTDIPAQWTSLQKSMTWDGHTEGVLLLGYGYVLYYNEKLLQDAGVSVPTTPDQLLSAAKALTKNGVYGFGSSTALSPNVFPNVSGFVVGEGQAWIKDGKYDLTDPGFVKAINDYRAVLKYAPQGMQTEQMRQLFFDGKIAMMIDGPFVYASKDQAAAGKYIKIAKAPFPNSPGNISNNLSMPANLSDDKKQAVWDFIKLAASPEWQAKYADLTDSVPPRNGVLTQDIISKHPELQVATDASTSAVSVLPDDKNVLANYNQFAQLVDSAMITLMTSNKSTEDVLSQLQDQLNSQVKP